MTALPDFSPSAPLFLIAGPCAMETPEMVMHTAATLKKICATHHMPLIFKSSFDKANRTSTKAARGLGIEQGLRLLAQVRNELSLPVITDVHWPNQAEAVAALADVLQIPAFLCRQTDLINACAATKRPLMIKKGQFLAPQDMLHVAAKARAAGATTVLLCERGASFGYNNLVADMRSLVIMRQTGCPVIFDATHAVQLPGADNEKSGGTREMVLPLARAATAVGINGLFVETHPNPSQAISDAASQWPLAEMSNLIRSVNTIDRAQRGL